jgi:hypothetical protein
MGSTGVTRDNDKVLTSDLKEGGCLICAQSYITLVDQPLSGGKE